MSSAKPHRYWVGGKKEFLPKFANENYIHLKLAKVCQSVASGHAPRQAAGRHP
jgi:hypothetical protein